MAVAVRSGVADWLVLLLWCCVVFQNEGKEQGEGAEDAAKEGAQEAAQQQSEAQGTPAFDVIKCVARVFLCVCVWSSVPPARVRGEHAFADAWGHLGGNGGAGQRLSTFGKA